MASLTFDITSRTATVALPDVSISVQEVLDQFRDFEDLPLALGYPPMVAASGKDALSGGSSTIITVRLLDGWQLKFADRPGPAYVETLVTDGNLVASDNLGADQTPFAPSDFTYVQFANATTGAILGITALETLAAAIDVSVAELVKAHFNKMITDPVAGTITLYDDDDVTPLRTGPLKEDADGTVPYQGKGADRREKMT